MKYDYLIGYLALRNWFQGKDEVDSSSEAKKGKKKNKKKMAKASRRKNRK